MTLKRIITDDKNIQLIQDNMDAALIPLQSGAMANASLIKKISLVSAQDNLIPHNLGHVPSLFFIGDLNANATVWSPNTSALNGVNWNSKVINLWCSANCTVSMWIT